MKSKPEQDDYYLRETLLEHGRSTDHNGIVVGSWKTEFFDCFDDCVPNGIMAINKLELGEGVDHNGITVGGWSNGFFNCCDDMIPNGLLAFCCPVISVAQITVRIGLAHYSITLGTYAVLYLLGLVAAAADDPILLSLCALAELIATASVACLRTKMRDLFSIPGTVFQDAALVVFCRPCVIAQMATHVDAYHTGKCMFRARDTLPGYVHE
ncbi:hypothetical protein KRP22_014417 [Phytophthora ramorum]|nr:hypothetical protein KRP22_8979 [Phytophthora ramorum]